MCRELVSANIEASFEKNKIHTTANSDRACRLREMTETGRVL